MNIALPGVLDTVIALVAVYLALAVFCSHVNEQIAAKIQLRGTKLYQGVLNLLVGQKNIVDDVFAHPLITSSSNDKNGKPKGDKGYRPSFIDSRNFSLAMWDAIQRASLGGAADPKSTEAPVGESNTVKKVDDPDTVIKIDTAAMSLIGAPGELFTRISSAVDKLPKGNLRAQLVALVNDSQGNYDRLLRATDAWFDRQMDRVTGWYKRNTQLILFVIGIVVVFLGGIDSIRIASHIYSDGVTRGGVAAAASKAVKDSKDAAGAAAELNTAFAKLPVDTYLTGLTGGWSDPADKDDGAKVHTAFLHFVGLVITVFAVGLGAPFWFDALGSLTNMRLAGQKPPDKADPKNNLPPPAP